MTATKKHKGWRRSLELVLSVRLPRNREHDPLFERLARCCGLSVIPQIFFISAGLAVLFVVCALLFNEPFAKFFGDFGTFIFIHCGWFYVLSVSVLLGFLIWIAFSRHGHLPLGSDHEPPQYGIFAWFAMLFAAGVGTVLMFWGVAEPLTHFAHSPLEDIEPGTRAAIQQAMTFALYHFGFHSWTVFTLPALAIGYFTYRKGLPMRISSLFYPVLGGKIHGPTGWAIDSIALLGTLFGIAVSLGVGTLQLSSGLQAVFGLPTSTVAQTAIVTAITAVATLSVALGLDKGIKRLSLFNLVIALGVLIFIWFTGPTRLITSGVVQNFGAYLQNLPWMAFWTEAYQETDWQQHYTVFYWAWAIAWAPFVGIFIARISRGRTIRQLVLGALGVPTLFTVIWFSVFGLAAINLELHQGVALSPQVQDDVAVVLFDLLAQFPWSHLTSILALTAIVVFLITSIDSAAFVVDLLSRRKEQPSLIRQRVFWTSLVGTIAIALLIGGGLDTLRQVTLVMGFPFCALLVFMAMVLSRALHTEMVGEIPVRDMEETLQGKRKINTTLLLEALESSNDNSSRPSAGQSSFGNAPFWKIHSGNNKSRGREQWQETRGSEKSAYDELALAPGSPWARTIHVGSLNIFEPLKANQFPASIHSTFLQVNDVFSHHHYYQFTPSYRALQKEVQETNHLRLGLSSVFAHVVLVVCIYIFVIALIPPEALTNSGSKFVVYRFIELGLVFIAIRMVTVSGVPLTGFGLTFQGWKPAILEAIPISLAVMTFLYGLKWACIQLGFDPTADGILASFQYIDWSYVTYLVVAPLHEFLARGVIQGSLQRLLIGANSTFWAICITAFLFGALHLCASICLGVAALVSSFLWGWMYARHQNLVGVSVSHFLIGNWSGLLGLWTIF